MQPAAGRVAQWLGREIRPEPAAGGNGLHHRSERNRVIRCSQGIGIAKVNLVLTGALLVVGALRADAHLLQRQANLSADVFPSVVRSDIHIARVVVRLPGGLTMLIRLEEIEFHLSAKGKAVSRRLGVLHSHLQKMTGVGLKYPAVRPCDVTEHPYHPAVFRPPGKPGKCGGVRPQK